MNQTSFTPSFEIQPGDYLATVTALYDSPVSLEPGILGAGSSGIFTLQDSSLGTSSSLSQFIPLYETWSRGLLFSLILGILLIQI